MTDSSSDEDDKLKLLQAVDKEFINDGMFRERLEDCEKAIPNCIPSLRFSEANDNDQCNLYGLNVTPEFQRYVAKHLTRLLDQSLKEVEGTGKQAKKQKIEEDTGVRLLYSSTKNICLQDPVDDSGAHNAKWKSQAQDIDSEEEKVKISESAVSLEWLLTGEAVKGWVKSTRGEVVPGVLKENGTANPTTKKKKKKKKAKTGHTTAESSRPK